MSEQNKFNLIDEKWIPVAGNNFISLKDVFSHNSEYALGGNALEKIVLLKLFLAIAQAAATPEDIEDYTEMSFKDLSEKCLNYLDKWHDSFYLYGDKPFLQIKGLKCSKPLPLSVCYPYIALGNNVVLKQTERSKIISSGEAALLILQLSGFGFGGKKTDNSLILSSGHTKKTGQAGGLLGAYGYLHSFYWGKNILESIYLNMLTKEDIEGFKSLNGIGTPVWENMPNGEISERAKELSESLMGRLLPLSRFMFIADDTLHFTDGIPTVSHKNGWVDPTISLINDGKDIKALWVNTEKRPWRELTSLLSFLSSNNTSKYDCPQLRICGKRFKYLPEMDIGIWSGGIAVSSNSGEQYCSGTNDYVESLYSFNTSCFNERWFNILEYEMTNLDKHLSKILYASIISYLKELNYENSSGELKKAMNNFWLLCESDFQSLINTCQQDGDTDINRKKFASHAEKIFNTVCPKITARQIKAYGKNYINVAVYLKLGRG